MLLLRTSRPLSCSSYYGNGQKKSFTAPDGVSYAYTYDLNNQLSAIQLPTGAITVNAYTWTAPERITLPGGTTRSHQYDPLMRLTAITAKDAFQNSLLSYQYSYDKAGNITNKATEHGTYSYGYDDLYRLTKAQNPSPLTAEAYGYDALGNRTTDSNLPGPWGYNENNQLTSINGIAFSYDENGNTATKTEGANTTTFVYDTADRLTEVKDTQGNTIARYAYDPFGRRLWKEANNQKTYFLYSNEGLIAETNNAGAITKLYGYRPKSTWTTDPLYLKEGNQYYFFQNDHLGTSQKLTAQNGNVVWSAKAQAFGQTTIDASATVINNLRFPGQYYDAETGLHYNWNRYYDPKVGRYVTSDPIGLDGGLNAYLYADGNAVNKHDPLGLSTIIEPPPKWDIFCLYKIYNFNQKCNEDINEALTRYFDFLDDCEKAFYACYGIGKPGSICPSPDFCKRVEGKSWARPACIRIANTEDIRIKGIECLDALKSASSCFYRK